MSHRTWNVTGTGSQRQARPGGGVRLALAWALLGGGVYIRDGTVRIDAQGFVQGNNAPFVLSSGGGIYRNGGTLHGDGSGDCEVHEGGDVCFNEPDNIAP